MPQVLIAVAGVLTFAAWLVAVVSWVLAVANRRPGVSLTSLLFRGFAAFDASNFTEKGQRHQRRFLLAFAAFFGCILLTAGAAAIGGAS